MHFTKTNRFLLLLVAGASFPGMAAEWSVEPEVIVRTGYNDNIRLTPGSHDSVIEYELTPSLKFGLAKENQGLSGNGSVSIRQYTGGTGSESSNALNREDYYLDTRAFHNTLLDRFNINLYIKRDSTQDSELDLTGNVIDDRATREEIRLSPSWSRLLNELTLLDLSYRYTNVEYTDDPGIQDLVAYKYHAASASLQRQLTPRVRGTLSAEYSNYLPSTDFKSRTTSLQAGLTTDFTETLVATLLLGHRQTTSDSFIGAGFCVGADIGATFPTCTGGIPIPIGRAKGETETSAPVVTASIAKTLETGILRANLTRSSSPSGNGELLDSTRLILFGEHKFSQTLTSSLKIQYTENEVIVNRIGLTPNQETRTFLRVIPRITWNWHQEWSIAGEYHYARSDDANLQTATRNAAYVILKYNPVKRFISR